MILFLCSVYFWSILKTNSSVSGVHPEDLSTLVALVTSSSLLTYSSFFPFKILTPVNNSVLSHNGREVSHILPSNSQTSAGVLQFNSILTLRTWRQHRIPWVKCSVSQDCLFPTSDASHKSRLLLVLLNQLTINQKFPGPPPCV